MDGVESCLRPSLSGAYLWFRAGQGGIARCRHVYGGRYGDRVAIHSGSCGLPGALQRLAGASHPWTDRSRSGPSPRQEQSILGKEIFFGPVNNVRHRESSSGLPRLSPSRKPGLKKEILGSSNSAKAAVADAGSIQKCLNHENESDPCLHCRCLEYSRRGWT